MKLTVCISASCQDFEKEIKKIKEKYNSLTIEIFNDTYYSDRKKSFKVRGGYSARLSPFALLTDDKKYVKAFYSEDNGCTVDNILNFLKQYLNESASNKQV